jgi:hypothetical protein
MRIRLGNVLYWLGCVIAFGILAIDIAEWFAEGRTHPDGVFVFFAFAAIAFIAWLIGRACRYVLSGV